MFSSRIFWKIYLNFTLLIISTCGAVGLFLIYGTRHSELREVEIYNIGIAAISIGVLSALLLGFFLARQIVLPLKRLTELADSIAKGDFEKRVSVNDKNGFGQLANALNSMAAQITEDISRRAETEANLQKTYDELERRVGERTVELSQINDLLNKEIIERQETEKTLKKETDLVELLQIVAVAANEADEIEAAAQFCLDKVCALTEWQLGHLNLLAQDGSGEIISTDLWCVREPERFEVFMRGTEKTRWRSAIGLPGQVLEKRRAIWVIDVKKDLHFIRKEWAEMVGIKSAFAFPILMQAKVMGVLEFFSAAEEEPDAKLLEVMFAIGTQLGQVIERKQAKEILEKERKFLDVVLDNLTDGLVACNARGELTLFNRASQEFHGLPVEPLPPEQWAEHYDLYHADGITLMSKEEIPLFRALQGEKVSNAEMVIAPKNKERRTLLAGGQPIFDSHGNKIGAVVGMHDITERKRAEAQLLHDAFHDGLTGLANRALFMDHLRITIDRSRSKHSNPYAVLFLDFDRFKLINDSFGHTEGDELLKQIARRLEAVTRKGDLAARLGGDEFVILLTEMIEETAAVQIAERIQNNFNKPFNLSSGEIFITASIGIALSSDGRKSAEEMLRDADIAMYRAKAKGRAQYQIFDQAMREHASRQVEIETEMHRALEQKEFQIFYQPIMNLETEVLVGFEALVRWHHPTRGMILPLDFIQAAEENNLILPLGDWILRESCRQMREWVKEFPAVCDLTISVNLSRKQFSQPDLAEQIAAILKETRLNSRRLKLEITESHLMENTETAIEIIDKLYALGVELGVDDFGTGHSSLSYLHRLPVHYLKIDRSFVSRMTNGGENSEIVLTIIRLAQNLKMKVIAESIETAEQFAQLQQLQCEFGQGYFFSKPLEAEEARMLIEGAAKQYAFTLEKTIINLDANM